MNLAARRGVAVREFPLKHGHGCADYLLFVDGEAVGVVEAKKEGTTLTGVEVQAREVPRRPARRALAAAPPAAVPLPSTGVETRFTNGLDPEPRSRARLRLPPPRDARPSGSTQKPLAAGSRAGASPSCRRGLGSPAATLRARLRAMPAVHKPGLWPAKVEAIRNLEQSLADDRPRALIQMATGSGKTFTRGHRRSTG